MATQADPVSQFQGLSPERQKALLGKMSPQQKQALKSGIDKKIAAKQEKPADKKEGFFSALGSDLKGMISMPRGVSPYPGTDIAGKTALAEQSHAQSESEKKAGYGTGYRAAAAAGSALGVNVPGMEDAAKKGDSAAVLGHAAALPLVMAASEAVGHGSPKAVEALKSLHDKGIPPALTKAATKPVIQKLLFDRASKVQAHIEQASDLFHQEVGERWKHIEKTIDEAKPEGSIDLSGVRQSTAQSVKEAIATPQKLPGTVSELQKTSEPPVVAGMRLDPSNAAHKALYDRLKDLGAFPDRDVASFAEVRQLRSKLGRELHSRTSTLSGESKSVGWKLYSDLTSAMKSAAEEHNLVGAFEDANKLHAQYMEDFVNPKSPLTKALKGNNPHEIIGPLSDPRYAEQSRRAMAKYTKHGMDPAMIDKEGMVFQKLKTGLPEQMKMSRWELMLDVPTMGAATGVRQVFNAGERAMAIRQAAKPNPVAVRAQALKAAAEKLGGKASVKEIMAEADKATAQQ